jgi:hypothetical protein
MLVTVNCPLGGRGLQDDEDEEDTAGPRLDALETVLALDVDGLALDDSDADPADGVDAALAELAAERLDSEPAERELLLDRSLGVDSPDDVLEVLEPSPGPLDALNSLAAL